ncbi:MAG: hypothetical protein QM736_05820 [Vicinamibacterales bacterium]
MDFSGEPRAVDTGEDHELEGQARLQQRHDVEQQVDALQRPEIRQMQQHRFVGRESEFTTDLIAAMGRRVRLEEIVHDFDRTLHAEQADGFRAHEFRDRRDRVGMFQGVADRRTVAGIAAEQRGVGAVERGDDAQPVFLVQHRAGEHCGGGVRHGVVNVQQVERVLFRHLGHLHRERQRVVGVFEEVVAVDRDRVEDTAAPTACGTVARN